MEKYPNSVETLLFIENKLKNYYYHSWIIVSLLLEILDVKIFEIWLPLIDIGSILIWFTKTYCYKIICIE